jgi:SAM-dependent methyltransferase
VIKNSMGSNVLWLAEWLTAAMKLAPGMRVLDLGCGRAASSIFLAREFDVQVWATDLWISASENLLRIADAGLQDRVFPIHADARALPYAGEFFDAIISLDSYSYYGTDDLYLNYLAHFVKGNGQIGIAGAGLVQEIEGGLPDHLNAFWTQDFWCLHSAPWWRRLWERTRIVDMEVAEVMPDGWSVWLEWQRTAHPANSVEISAIEADAGQTLGYIRMVARRRADAKLETYCWPDSMLSYPLEYEKQCLLR